MMTWPLLYKLFNNKHTAKNPNIQMFRLRRKNQLISLRKFCATGHNNGRRERKSTIPA